MTRPGYRAALFGIGGLGQVVRVLGPETVEACGLYVHVDDIEIFEKETLGDTTAKLLTDIHRSMLLPKEMQDRYYALRPDGADAGSR